MRTLPASLRRLLWLFGLLWLVYLVVGNVFLNTAARSLANRKTETFHAQWSWAWTVWPGQLHAYDLSIGGHARQRLWSAHGDSAGGRLMLWPLLRRELRFASVRAAQVSVDVQPTPIDHRPPPFRSDAWRITVARVVSSSVKKVHWGQLLVEGEGDAEAGFTHQMRGGASQIFPSRLTMSAARVSYANWPLLHDASFSLGLALDPFTHDEPPGWRKAKRAIGRLKIEAATMAVALGANRHGAQSASASPLPGHLSADLSFERGALLPGGWLQWNAPVAITEADGSQQRRRGQLDLAVKADSLELHARIPPPPGADGARAMNQLEAHLQYATRQLLPQPPAGERLRRLSGSVEARWHFVSLRWLGPLLASKPWLRLDGEGDLEAALKLDAGRLVPGSTLDVPHVALRADLLDNVFAGDARAHAAVVVAGSVKTQLKVERFTLTPVNAPEQTYLRGHDLRIDTTSSDDLVQLRDTLDAHLQFANAEVPDLRVYNRYLPGKSLEFLGGSGTLDADLHINGRGDISNGKLGLRSKQSRLALGVSRISGDLNMQTALTLARHGDGRTFDLDNFSLGMAGVQVEGTRDPPWWARFTIEHGQLDWNRPMSLRGSATMVMKDVSLLLSLFADRSAFPKWIASVINDGQARAQARVQVQKGDFLLDQLVASNQRVDLLAHLRVRDGQPSGDLYARWGILGLGVALADGKRQFHLLHARDWYDAQPDLIPAAATAAPQKH